MRKLTRDGKVTLAMVVALVPVLLAAEWLAYVPPLPDLLPHEEGACVPEPHSHEAFDPLPWRSGQPYRARQ